MTPKTGVDGRCSVQRCTGQDGGLAVNLHMGVHGVPGSGARHDNILIYKE